MKIDYVNGDDWVGLYIDGKLVTEDHSIGLTDFAYILMEKGVEMSFTTHYPDMEWLENEGNLPETLTEVKF